MDLNSYLIVSSPPGYYRQLNYKYHGKRWVFAFGLTIKMSDDGDENSTSHSTVKERKFLIDKQRGLALTGKAVDLKSDLGDGS